MDSTQLWLAGAACLMTGARVRLDVARAASSAIGAGVLAFVAVSRTPHPPRARRGLGRVGAAARLALIGLMFANFGALAMRLQETTEAGDWGRRAIWRDTWRMAQDFWLAGVGAGAFEQGMLLYQQGSRVFFFNHAHDEYLQIFAEGGCCSPCRRRSRRSLERWLIASRLRGDRTPIFWIRAGAIAGIVAVAVQSVFDTGLRTPANGVLFAIVAAIACHEPRRPTGAAERRRPGGLAGRVGRASGGQVKSSRPGAVQHAPRTPTRLTRLSDQRAEEDLARRRVLEEGADERAVLVEARRGADDRHDAVGVGELEEAVDRLIAQLGDDVAQLVLRREFVGELLAPARARRRTSVPASRRSWPAHRPRPSPPAPR